MKVGEREHRLCRRAQRQGFDIAKSIADGDYHLTGDETSFVARNLDELEQFLERHSFKATKHHLVECISDPRLAELVAQIPDDDQRIQTIRKCDGRDLFIEGLERVLGNEYQDGETLLDDVAALANDILSLQGDPVPYRTID